MSVGPISRTGVLELQQASGSLGDLVRTDCWTPNPKVSDSVDLAWAQSSVMRIMLVWNPTFFKKNPHLRTFFVLERGKREKL